MNKKAMVWVAAALILAGASIWTGPAAATAGGTGSAIEGPGWHKGEGERHHRGEMSGKEFEAYRLERLKEMASYFGIATEGKTADQLKQELKAAKEANAEKWEAFKAEHRAKRFEYLKQIAKEHGIETDGKSEEQLHQELRKLHGDKGPGRFKDKRKESVQEQKQAKPGPKPEVKPEQKPGPKPEVKPEQKPAPKPEVKPEQKAAPKPELQSEQKTAPKSEQKAVPKSGARSE